MAQHIIIVVPTWVVWLAFVAFTVSAVVSAVDVVLRWQLMRLTKRVEARKRELQDIRARSI